MHAQKILSDMADQAAGKPFSAMRQTGEIEGEWSMASANDDVRKELGQYFTPRWAAEAIVERYFSHLGPGSLGVEPSCGDGRFLMAMHDDVRMIGVEIDPVHAAAARMNSGREVIEGDFLKVDLPGELDFVIGNPPFTADTVAGFLERSHGLLKEGGECGFILPAYILQTSSKVEAFNSKWSISTELMPRNLFPGLSLPLTFTRFSKDKCRKLFGFFLFKETAEFSRLKKNVKETLNGSVKPGSVWRQVVNAAYEACGCNKLHLADLYAAVQDKPSNNPNWKEQIRKILQKYPEFTAMGDGVWVRSSNTDGLMAVAGSQRQLQW